MVGINQDTCRLLMVYASMMRRCYSTEDQQFKDYGKRGIFVCEEWKWEHMPFINWSMSNGYRKGLTLDRENNDGPYSPENCRWVSRTVQARNRTNNRVIEFRGRRCCVAEWAEELGIPYFTLIRRLVMGWSVEQSLTTPVRPCFRKVA